MSEFKKFGFVNPNNLGLDDWKEKGFGEKPVCIIAWGNELIYRIYGGSSKHISHHYVPFKIDSVSEAEKNLNIAQYGNLAFLRGAFKVKPGTKMWFGKVGSGLSVYDKSGKLIEGGESRDFIQNENANQIYIEDESAVIPIGGSELIKQDWFIGRGSNANN